MLINKKQLESLVCPYYKTPLIYQQDAQELISDQAGLAFKIQDKYIDMRIKMARKLGEKEKGKYL